MRTKQTACKSTGDRMPRKMLAFKCARGGGPDEDNNWTASHAPKRHLATKCVELALRKKICPGKQVHQPDDVPTLDSIENGDQQDDIFVIDDLSNGKELNKLRAINTYNDQEMDPFEYVTSTEYAKNVGIPCKNGPPLVRPTKRFQVLYKDDQLGWALQTLDDIEAGAPLFEYIGVLNKVIGCGDGGVGGGGQHQSSSPSKQQRVSVTAPVMGNGNNTEKAEDEKDNYIVGFEHDGHFYQLDALRKGNMARFVNHSCQPNCCALLTDTTTTAKPDSDNTINCTTNNAVMNGTTTNAAAATAIVAQQQQQHLQSGTITNGTMAMPAAVPSVVIYAVRRIFAGEELTMDYGENWWLAKADSLYCQCGSEECQYDEDWCAAAVAVMQNSIGGNGRVNGRCKQTARKAVGPMTCRRQTATKAACKMVHGGGRPALAHINTGPAIGQWSGMDTKLTGDQLAQVIGTAEEDDEEDDEEEEEEEEDAEDEDADDDEEKNEQDEGEKKD